MTDELSQLLREAWEYNMTNIHTSFPGKVVSYDPKTRRADIQPSLKRQLPNKSFVDFPIIPDVPVIFPGTSEYTIHFPLKEKDEVDVHVCERSTDVWRDSGDKGIEDSDPRRFNLQDCYATPGLQPVHFIPTEEKGIAIIHHKKWDGDFISSIAMDDDKIEALYKDETKDSFSFLVTKDKVETIHKKDNNDVYYNVIEKNKIESVYKKDDVQIAKTTIDDSKIETLYKDIISAIMEDVDVTVKYKQKCQVKMEDDHLNANTEKCTVDMTADVVMAKNSQLTMKLNAAKFSVKNGLKDMFTVIDTFMADVIASKFVGSPSQHVISPPDIVKLNKDKTDFGQIMEAG
jgi:hypothetical protein